LRGQEAPAPSAEAAGDTTAEELKARLDRHEDVFILDVRNPEEYTICRIPGSTLIPLSELPRRVGELDRNREIVVHCKSGMRSQKAARLLRDQGFTRLKNLKGGILAWAERIDPTVPKY
jgi:adenylyltransferase/sulfurtransferase